MDISTSHQDWFFVHRSFCFNFHCRRFVLHKRWPIENLLSPKNWNSFTILAKQLLWGNSNRLIVHVVGLIFRSYTWLLYFSMQFRKFIHNITKPIYYFDKKETISFHVALAYRPYYPVTLGREQGIAVGIMDWMNCILPQLFLNEKANLGTVRGIFPISITLTKCSVNELVSLSYFTLKSLCFGRSVCRIIRLV